MFYTIECENLNFRTWVKRLTRRKLYLSKLKKMHDIVIGLLINKIKFGLDIYAKTHTIPLPSESIFSGHSTRYGLSFCNLPE
ncbi:MAG: IS1 family transposase [Endozoicomonas sp.]|uniref:IS1 family transposase n=1 Tax=Endozoicomonas sp. TaxID=1892382 RepID=UPI003D9B25E3